MTQRVFLFAATLCAAGVAFAFVLRSSEPDPSETADAGFSEIQAEAPPLQAEVAPARIPTVPESPVDPTIPESALASPALTASFTEHLVGDPPSFHITGEVENTSSVLVGKVTVHAVFLNESGEEVFSEDAAVEDDHLAPGERVPWSLWVPAAHAFSEIRYETVVAPYSRYSSAPTDLTSLELVPHEPRMREGSSGVSFSGRLINRTDTQLKFLKVRVTARDDAERILGIQTTYAVAGEPLAPGATARFSMNLFHLERRDGTQFVYDLVND